MRVISSYMFDQKKYIIHINLTYVYLFNNIFLPIYLDVGRSLLPIAIRFN